MLETFKFELGMKSDSEHAVKDAVFFTRTVKDAVKNHGMLFFIKKFKWQYSWILLSSTLNSMFATKFHV